MDDPCSKSAARPASFQLSSSLGLGFRISVLDARPRWEFLKIRGALFRGPYDKDPTI